MKTYYLDQIEELKVLGRTTKERRPLSLFWTGAGIELQAKASELWVNVKAAYRYYEPWIDILINDTLIQRFMVTEGTHRICVFRGMNLDEVKKVQILRDTQAMGAESDTVLQIESVSVEGTFEKAEEYDLKMEFIGDSITSGEGCIGSLVEMDWLPSWMSAVKNYAYMTAQKLHAQYNCISQCGWGFYTSWDSKRECSLPPYYEQICGVTDGGMNAELGCKDTWDFTQFQPDVIVINLGTNDATGLNLNPDSDPILAEEGKKQLPQMQKTGVDFLKQLRRCNPNATIIWVYGMLGIPIEKDIMTIIDTYRQETSDADVHYLRLEDTAVTGVGARMHPGQVCHEHAAEKIAEFVKSII